MTVIFPVGHYLGRCYRPGYPRVDHVRILVNDAEVGVTEDESDAWSWAFITG